MPVNVNYTNKTAGSTNSSSNNITSNRAPSGINNGIVGMDDGGASKNIRGRDVTVDSVSDIDDIGYESLLHSHKIFKRNEIDLFNKTYRFWLLDPYGAVSSAKEFLFFTKPDLNIYKRNDTSGELTEGKVLNDVLQNYPFWVELSKGRSRIINSLQLSADPKDNFNHLLQNQVISNLEVPALEAETIETATNMYGVGFSYRGSSEASDDTYDFSLEFKDTRWLDIYYFFKSFEEYETFKNNGLLRPRKKYIENNPERVKK